MGLWDSYQDDGESRPGYVTLGDGESFTGKLVRVEPHVIPAGTFNYQENDLRVPRVFFSTPDGREMILDATATVLRNALIEKDPQTGDTVTVTRKGKPKGKSWIDFGVSVVRGGSIASAPEEKEAPAAPATASGFDEEPPF